MTDQKLKIDFDFPRLIVLPDSQWISDGRVAIRADLTGTTEGLPVVRADAAKFPTRATSTEQTTAPIGPATAAVLWVNRDDANTTLTVHESDKDGMHAICLDGDMVGFANIGRYDGDAPWIPTVDQMPRVFRVANELSRFVYSIDDEAWRAGNPADTMFAAYRVIMAYEDTEGHHD